MTSESTQRQKAAAARCGQLWDSGFYCAESVLTSVTEANGVDCKLIPRIATGLCSGLARTGGLCGALAGAMLAISAVLGRDAPEDSEDACYSAISQVIERFTERFGATDCLTLAGCHLGTDAGQIHFQQSGQCAICKNYASQATLLAMEALESTPPS